MKQPISQIFYSYFWRVFDIWPLCASGADHEAAAASAGLNSEPESSLSLSTASEDEENDPESEEDEGIFAENSSPLASTEDDGKETSFPSDVSVAGSEPASCTARLTEASAMAANFDKCSISSNDKSSISAIMSSTMPVYQGTATAVDSPVSQYGIGKGPKPPTPIATPRCSSPPSNIFASSKAEPLAPPLTAGVSSSQQQNAEVLSAQEIFFNIEQLTQKATESFDMSRKSVKSVNRETITNVGKSVVDNISLTKKLEFFKALTGSTGMPNRSQPRPPQEPQPPTEPPKKSTQPPEKTTGLGETSQASNLGIKEGLKGLSPRSNKQTNDVPDIRSPVCVKTEPSIPTNPLNSGNCDEITSQPDPSLTPDMGGQTLAPVGGNGGGSTRPMSPNTRMKLDIAFPKSQLGDIASPRPTSRIPKKDLKCTVVNNKTSVKQPSSCSSTAAEAAASAAAITVTATITSSATPSTNNSINRATASDMCPAAATQNNDDEATKLSMSPGMKQEDEKPLLPNLPLVTGSGSRRTEIETTTSRFLAEHHPQLKRSNSTMSNASLASSYSQTTQELFNSISSDISGLATQTSSLLDYASGFFGYGYGMEGSSNGNNKPTTNYVVSDENNITIKETVDRVLLGEGIGWLKLNRLKKLMEEEMHRSLMLNYLQRKFGQHLTRDGHIEDLCLGKTIWKGVLRLITAVIHGLEVSQSGSGASQVSLSSGLASAFQLLELIHTHYWSPAETMPGISHATSPIISDNANGTTGGGGGPSSASSRLYMLQQADNESIDSTDSSTLGLLQDNTFETESEAGSIALDTATVFRTKSDATTANHSSSPRRSVLSEGEIDHLSSSSTLNATAETTCHVLSKHLPKKSIWSGNYRFRCGSLHAVMDDDDTCSSNSSSQWTEKSYLFEGLVVVVPNSTTNGDNPEQRRRLSGVGSSLQSSRWVLIRSSLPVKIHFYLSITEPIDDTCCW